MIFPLRKSGTISSKLSIQLATLTLTNDFLQNQKSSEDVYREKSFAAAAPTLAQDSDLWKDKLKEYATPEPWYARILFCRRRR